MPDINEEMRSTAEYAKSIAEERYGLQLDFSDESLANLDNILEKIYWGFSGHSRDESEGGLIYNSAIIWGSYLGEYMRLKWGGTWLIKDTERRLSIASFEFSPVNFIFQRITNHPEYRANEYVQVAKNVIYTAVGHPQKAPIVPGSIGKPSKQNIVKSVRKSIALDRRTIYIAGGILGILIIAAVSVAGYAIISAGGLPASDLFAVINHTSSPTPFPTIPASLTIAPTNTAFPTITTLPTYTASPTKKPGASHTPLITSTATASTTPTITVTPSPTETGIPWRSPTPTRGPTRTTRPPTRTPTSAPSATNAPSPTNTSAPTATNEPPPTATTEPPPTSTTEPPPTATNVPPPTVPPPRILSCSINPSTIPPDTNTTLTFAVHFSEPGYGMSVGNFDPGWPGHVGCSAPAGGDTASCNGSSGSGTGSVTVTIDTPLGSCSVGYSAQ